VSGNITLNESITRGFHYYFLGFISRRFVNCMDHVVSNDGMIMDGELGRTC